MLFLQVFEAFIIEFMSCLLLKFLDFKCHFLPGKSPLFEIRRIDPEADNSSKQIEPAEDVPIVDVKVKSQKSQFIEVRGVEEEAVTPLILKESVEEHHVLDVKVATTNKREHTRIDSDLEDEHYNPKSKKVDSNVSPVRKSYPLSIYTYKVLMGLDFPFFLVYGFSLY